jgi:hypothetical protein
MGRRAAKTDNETLIAMDANAALYQDRNHICWSLRPTPSALQVSFRSTNSAGAERASKVFLSAMHSTCCPMSLPSDYCLTWKLRLMSCYTDNASS